MTATRSERAVGLCRLRFIVEVMVGMIRHWRDTVSSGDHARSSTCRPTKPTWNYVRSRVVYRRSWPFDTVPFMGILLCVVLLLVVFGGLPRLGLHSYGYGPSGIGGILLAVVVVLLLTGRL